MNNLYRFDLLPLDPLFFGDNRSARQGRDHDLGDQDMNPVTLFGAIGQYVVSGSTSWPGYLLGDRYDGDILELPDRENTAALVGYAYHEPRRHRSWFPLPTAVRVLVQGEDVNPLPGDFEWITPRRSEEIIHGGPWTFLPLAKCPGKDKRGFFCSESFLDGFLTGGTPSPGDHLVPREVLYRVENRTGIAINDQTGVVAEGMLFQRPYRHLAPAEALMDDRPDGLTIRAWYRLNDQLPETLQHGLAFLGGDRARVMVSSGPAGDLPLAEIRDKVVAAATQEGWQGVLLYLMTPAHWQQLPRLDGRDPCCLVMARGRRVSGWDAVAGRPRPLMDLVGEGTVIFYQVPDPSERKDLVTRYWCRAVTDRGAVAGYGRVLCGVWK